MNKKRKDGHFGEHLVDDQRCTLLPGRKKKDRISYQRWVADSCGIWGQRSEGVFPPDRPANAISPEVDDTIIREVRKAVAKLQPEERRFVEMFYFEFKSYREIAQGLDKKMYKLARIHQRAIGKLRILLADFVKEHFMLNVEQKTDCIICNSPHQEELDRLIRSKKKEETYSRLIRTFRQKYGIEITTPQMIIGHRRKHTI